MLALIDSHIFLHMLGDPVRLTTRQRAFLEDSGNDLLLSLASVWEITIKYGLGKLRLPTTPENVFPAQLEPFGVDLLPITLEHVLHVHKLPPHHHDPFDRLIISQAQLNNLPVLSSDTHFPSYGIQVIV